MAKKTNITINGKDYYRISATVGTDLNGKRIRKWFYGDSKKDAIAARDAYIEEQSKETHEYNELTFEDVFVEWLEYVYKNRVAASSYNRAESLYRLWIKSAHFAYDPILSIKNIHLQRHLSTLESDSTHRKVLMILKTFYKYCISEKIVTHDPVASIKERKDTRISGKKYLSKSDIHKLMDRHRESDGLFIFIFALFTGMRQGEIMALTHGDIDFNTMQINVNKSLNRVTVNGRNQIIISPTKTEAGIRKIPIMSELVDDLKEHIKKEQLKLFAHEGRRLDVNDYLFTQRNGAPLRGDRLNNKWKALQVDLDIEPIVFHGLRHTFCSLLARQGVALKTAATLMGHSDIETTSRIYTHIEQDVKEAAIEKLSNFLTSDPPSKTSVIKM